MAIEMYPRDQKRAGLVHECLGPDAGIIQAIDSWEEMLLATFFECVQRDCSGSVVDPLQDGWVSDVTSRLSTRLHRTMSFDCRCSSKPCSPVACRCLVCPQFEKKWFWLRPCAFFSMFLSSPARVAFGWKPKKKKLRIIKSELLTVGVMRATLARCTCRLDWVDVAISSRFSQTFSLALHSTTEFFVFQQSFYWTRRLGSLDVYPKKAEFPGRNVVFDKTIAGRRRTLLFFTVITMRKKNFLLIRSWMEVDDTVNVSNHYSKSMMLAIHARFPKLWKHLNALLRE